MSKAIHEYQQTPFKSIKTIRFQAKCSDMFDFCYCDKDSNPIVEGSGYTPSFLTTHGSGSDYIDLEIDLETGQILNWKKPSTDNILDHLCE